MPGSHPANKRLGSRSLAAASDDDLSIDEVADDLVDEPR
jgi:hypothetical protein